ncbi:MAG: hypothetical protein HYZ48_03690, partial [Chlamydiales bacterium]|nr:hypothetical protein [Chlamydiales bacterium]
RLPAARTGGWTGFLDKITHAAARAILCVAILFISVPAIIGSFIKCVSNQPLWPTGNFTEWELSTSPAQRDQCQNLGIYDFNRETHQICQAFCDFAEQHPEYPKASSIHVSRHGEAGYFYIVVNLSMSKSDNHRPIQRPNGDEFFRNIVNGFRRESPSPIALQQIRVLEDLLLGIRSGTDEDYRILQEHLASSTHIQFMVHCLPEPRNDNEREAIETLKGIDIKFFY